MTQHPDPWLALSTVAQIRRALWVNGFRPVAVYSFDAKHEAAGKAPKGDDWNGRARSTPPETTITAPTVDALNTGILCDGLRAIDIDIDDTAIAKVAADVALETLGAAPRRYRANSPRALLLYRAAEGEPGKRQIAGERGKVEVLGYGQQFVAFGRHFSGAEIAWDTSPTAFHRDQLPVVTEAAVEAYLVRIANLIGAKPPKPAKAEYEAPAVVDQPPTMDDRTVWTHAASAANGDKFKRLWNGQWQGDYHSQSEADFALVDILAFHTPSFDQVVSLFRQSGLGQREKAARDDYVHPMVQKALGERTPLVPGLADIADRMAAKAAPAVPPPVPQTAPPPGQHRKAMTTYSAAELQARTFTPVEFVVPGLIPRGVTLLAGKPKSGKSWIALDVAWAVSSGTSVINDQPCQQGDVLYAALEDNPRRMQSRMAIQRPHEACPHSLQFTHGLASLDAGGEDDLRSWLMAHPNAKLIIVDVLTKVRPTQRKTEDKYTHDYRTLSSLNQLANEFNIGVIAVHHVRKLDAEDIFDTISGTLGLTGAADTIVVFKKSKVGDVLMGRGRDIEEFDHMGQFGDDRRWRLANEPRVNLSGVMMSVSRKAIMHAIATGHTDAKAIALATGIAYDAVRSQLTRMAQAGDVICTSRGVYQVSAQHGVGLWTGA